MERYGEPGAQGLSFESFFKMMTASARYWSAVVRFFCRFQKVFMDGQPLLPVRFLLDVYAREMCMYSVMRSASSSLSSENHLR
jgi:hypothetical protein